MQVMHRNATVVSSIHNADNNFRQVFSSFNLNLLRDWQVHAWVIEYLIYLFESVLFMVDQIKGYVKFLFM